MEEIYVACLPWLREQASSKLTPADGEGPKTSPELTKLLGDAMEEFAELMEGLRYQTDSQAQTPTDRLLEKKDMEGMGGGESSSSSSLEELIRALGQLQMLLQSHENVETQGFRRRCTSAAW